MRLARVAALCALPLLAAACGASHTAATATTAAGSTAHVPVSPAPTTVVAYFLKDGEVAPVRLHVPHTLAVATAALTALFGGPPAGYDTALPPTQGATVAIAGGVATAILPAAVHDPSRAARAQLVFTLTRFPTVSSATLRLAGGTAVVTQATRADYEAETPTILVDSPLPDDDVQSPLRVSGTAVVFEATVRIELVQGQAQLGATTATASRGAPARGAFAASLPFTASGPATLKVYAPNNEGSGPPLHEVDVPVTLAP